MLDTAHEGYEYQDYLTVVFALQEILSNRQTEMIIDRKTVDNDKFDDLKLLNDKLVSCYQIKYSDEEHNHKLTLYDLSNGNSHDTSLSGLFKSWKDLKSKYCNVKLVLCVAWEIPAIDDDIWKIIEECSDSDFVVPSHRFVVDADKLWPSNEEPLKNWKKFRKEMEGVEREEFVEFCKKFSIETKLPKASLDLQNPGKLETILLGLTKKLGIGIYPNQALVSEDIIYRLAAIVKNARALGKGISVAILPQHIGLITDYGMLNQEFYVDDILYVNDSEQFVKVKNALDEKGRIVFLGNPGSGKSWFVEKFAKFLTESGKHVIRFNCYVALNDAMAEERIKTKVLYGNFVGQLIKEYPHLSEKKKSLYGANKEELENLLQFVSDDCYIIIDGLDHIRRQYDLYKSDITLRETEIVEELSLIVFPDKVRIMLASQPLEQFQKFFSNGYAKVEIEKWTYNKTKYMMGKYRIADKEFEEGGTLSGFLQIKSQGNVLYLNYLLRQLQGKDISRTLLEAIPNYDPLLKDYYSYLYSQIINKRIVFALCGVDFYLSSEELKEITGYGDIVDSELNIIYPLLNENIASGGILLYHESFRRYIIEDLKMQKINISKTIYRDIIDWLSSKDFYAFRKAYCHLIKLLFQTEQYEEIVKFVQPNFVLESIKYGYSYNLIKQNIGLFELCGSRLKSLPLIAMANELDNVMEVTSYEVSNSKDYFQALCDLKGPEQLNSMLEYDGKATFTQETGLMICYICSKASIMPWWKLYIDAEKTEYTSDEYPYYFRALVDKNGVEIIPSILADIENLETNARTRFQEALYDDVKEYLGIDKFCNIVKENNLKYWKNQIDEHEEWFYAQSQMGDAEILDQMDRILKLNAMTEEETSMLNCFFSQITIRLKSKDNTFCQQMIANCTNINWFYNWIIFTLKIIEIQVDACEKHTEDNTDRIRKEREENVIFALEMLLKDTEVFKGKPRTCDLYGARNLIIKTFYFALTLIETNEFLGKALSVLEKVSQETTTSLDNTNGGPLPDYSFIEILSKIMVVSNKEIILPFILRTKKASEDTEVYGTTASVDFQIASLIAEIDKVEAERYYAEGVHYLLAYGYHKEVSIEQILSSYPFYAKADPESAKKIRLEVTTMTIALLNHTDGRITNRYLNVWFEKLLETDINYALSFLQGYQLKVKSGWILETMILDAAVRISYEEKYDEVAIKLLESLPNNVTNDLIEASIRIMERLVLYNKSEAKRVYINIMSRFNLGENTHSQYERRLSEEDVERLLTIGKRLEVSITQYELYFGRIEKGNAVLKKEDKSVVFECDTFFEAQRWFRDNFLSEKVYNDIIDFIEKKVEQNEEILALFHLMIDKDSFGENERGQIEHIKYLLEHAHIDNVVKATVYCLIFCKSRSWGSGLNDTDAFVKACMYNQDKAMEILYEELPNTIRNRGTVVSKGIIRALDAIGHNEDMIIETWKHIYPIMKLRFPNFEICEELGNDNAESMESLIGIILGRMLDGEKERMQVGYSYLEDCWCNEKDDELVIALTSFLKNFKEYNYLTQYAVLCFIQKNVLDFSQECYENVMSMLVKIYPTNDYLLDMTILALGLQIYLIEKGKQKHFTVADITKCLQPNILQELGDKTEPVDAEINLFGVDKHLRLLLNLNLDGKKVYRKIRASKKVHQLMEKFVSPMHRLTVDNTVFKSYIMQYAMLEWVEYSTENSATLSAYEIIPAFSIDFEELDLYRKSRHIVPEKHLYDRLDEDSSVPFVYSEKNTDYQRIACVEILINSDGHRDVSIIEGTQGICLRNSLMPLKKELLHQFRGMEEIPIEDAKGAMCFNGSKYDSNFEMEMYLWVINDISREFCLALAYDREQNEYVGIDMETDEVVLKFHNWRCNYIGDSEYRGDEIPLYNGAELLMKTSYIRKLETLYGNLYMRTIVKKVVDIKDGIDKTENFTTKEE